MSSESVSKKRKREKSVEIAKNRRISGDPFRNQLIIPLVPFDRPANARPRQPPEVCPSRAELSENPNVRIPPTVSPAELNATQQNLPEKENEEVRSPIAKKKKLVAKNKPNFKSSIAGQAGLSKKPIRLANPNKLSKPKTKDFHSISEKEEMAAKIMTPKTSPTIDLTESEEKDNQKRKDQECAKKGAENLEEKKQKRKEEKRAKKEAALKEAAKKEAALKEAALKEASLKEASLKEASLKEAALKEAALKEAALKEAALKEAALKEAALKEAALKEAALKEAAIKEREEEEKNAAGNESMTDDDEPLPALIQKLNEEEEAQKLANEIQDRPSSVSPNESEPVKDSLETIWAQATEKKNVEEKEKQKAERKREEIIIEIEDDDDVIPSNSSGSCMQPEIVDIDQKSDDEEERAPEEQSFNEPENDFLAFHQKRLAEKKRRASAANESLKLQTNRPSNQIIAEEKKQESDKNDRESEEKKHKAEKKKRKTEQRECGDEEKMRKAEKKKSEAKEKIHEDEERKEKLKPKEVAPITDGEKAGTSKPPKVKAPIGNEEEERRKRKEKKRAKKEAALKEREKEKKRLKKERRRKEEEALRQEEEEFKRKKEEEEAKRIADAQAIEEEARARAVERKKREAEEAEANPQPKEEKSFHEIWLVISYKSGCSGHRIVEYTADNGKQWYEKQMLLSLNDRIAKKKSKYWCSLEYVYPLEFSSKKLEGCTDIRNERTPNLGEWEITRVLDIKIGPDTILYHVEFKKFRKQIVVNKYFGANDNRKPLANDRKWLADFEMDFFLKNPENNKELTQRIKKMIIAKIGNDDVALDRFNHAREKCNSNEKREGHFPKAQAHLAKKDGDVLENGVSVRIISESGEFADKKNFKQTRDEMLKALDDIDSFTSICKLPPSEPILPKNKDSTELPADYSAPAISFSREKPDMFTVKNEFYRASYLNYEKERVKYYRDKVKECEQDLKRAEDYYRSNMKEWKAQKRYNLVRDARWARDRKSAELKTLQKKLMDSERYMFPTHKIDKFQTDTECLKDDTKDMIYIQQDIYGLAKDKRKCFGAFNLIAEREEVRLKNMNTSKHVPLCEHEEFKSH